MRQRKIIWWVLAFTAIVMMASPATYGQGPAPPNDNIVANNTGGYDVYPVGGGDLTHTHPQFGVSCTEDVHNVQWALDNADSGPGVVVLLKAGTFNFGDWRANEPLGGTVMLHKQMTLRGDGFDANGDPRSKIQGGGHDLQQDDWQSESMTVAFGGDGHDGVIESIWLEEPHCLGIACNGTFGCNFTDPTVRSVKVTDPSPEIPPFAVQRDGDGNPIGASMVLVKGITFGGNFHPGMGPRGTVVIEDCDISNDYDVLPEFINPFTGDPMPEDAYEADGIGLWGSSTVSHEVRNNRFTWQGTGICCEGLGDHTDPDTGERTVGTTVIEGNEITMLGGTWQEGVGYRATGPRPYVITRNEIRMLSGGDGMVLTNDCEGFGPHVEGDQFVVTQNDIEVQGGVAGSAAMRLGYVQNGANSLVDAEIRANKLRGSAQYGVSTYVADMVNASANNLFLGNNLAHLDILPEGAHYYFGPDTHDNAVRGYSGVVMDEGTDNVITGDGGTENLPQMLPETGVGS